MHGAQVEAGTADAEVAAVTGAVVAADDTDDDVTAVKVTAIDALQQPRASQPAPETPHDDTTMATSTHPRRGGPLQRLVTECAAVGPHQQRSACTCAPSRATPGQAEGDEAEPPVQQHMWAYPLIVN